MRTRLSVLLLCLAFACTALAGDPSRCNRDAAPGQAGAVVFSLHGEARLALERTDADGIGTTRCLLEAQTTFPFHDVTYYAVELPAGEYRISDVSGLVDKERTGARFRVQAGHRSDLGRLLFWWAPTYDGMYGGTSPLVRKNTRPELFGAMARVFELPALESPWLETSPASDAAVLAELRRFNDLSLPFDLGARGVAFSSLGGSLWLRSPAGAWKRVDVPDTVRVLDVLVSAGDDAHPVVVGEAGLFARLGADDRLSMLDRGNLSPTRSIIFVDGDDTTGWVVITLDEHDMGVFRSARLEGGDWQRIGTEHVFTHSTRNPHVFLWRVRGGFGYVLSGGRVRLYDRATGAWRDSRVPERLGVQDVRARGDAITVLGMPGKGNDDGEKSIYGMGNGLIFQSRDGGATWSALTKPGKRLHDAPVATATGTLLQLFQGLRSDRPKVVFASGDNGATWTQRPGELAADARVAALADGRLFAISKASLLESTDDGATWHRVVPPALDLTITH